MATEFQDPEIMLTTENKDLEGIQNTIQLLFEGAEHKKHLLPGFSHSIFRVPSILRDVSPGCFDPRIVSIGPLHRDDENVQACEAWKPTYMIKLMERTGKPQEEIMKSCVEKVYSLLDRIKECYIWNKTYDDVEIAQMMVLDACFILEFAYRAYFIDDDIFLVGSVFCDLLLLENQIPFFVLDEIYRCTLTLYQKKSLVEFIRPLFNYMIFGTDMAFTNTKNISIDDTQHILCLLHQCYMPPNDMIISSSRFLKATIYPTVTDLDMDGVNFKPNQNSTWVMGMEVKLQRFLCCFGSWGKPTLKMPILEVSGDTEPILRNLVAYEQTCKTTDFSYFSTYVSAMDKLVNTASDVAKLVDSGVLINHMGSNEEVTNMINSLTKNVVITGPYHHEHWSKLNTYRNRYWPKQVAKMKRTYFNSPWNIIALFAGILYFVLTFLQTFFTIMSAT